QSLESSPRWAAITSLFPEHLDWHGSERQYYRDKLNLIAHTPRAVVVNGLDNRLVSQATAACAPESIVATGLEGSFHLGRQRPDTAYFYRGRLPLFPRQALPLLGEHNARNLCVALGVLEALGIDCVTEASRIADAVSTFQGLPHRLQQIPDPLGELTFVNDSLSTAPQSAVAALESFDGVPVTLIVGGKDRGLDYQVLRDYLVDYRGVSVTVLAIPDSGERIADALRGIVGLSVEVVTDLPAAVARAREVTPYGGAVLLSPAAPSYGQFTDHVHRGEVFRRAVEDTGGRVPRTPRSEK
ncbi:MAG: Mur ligase family protein, partial [Mycobacteriales bacterium]